MSKFTNRLSKAISMILVTTIVIAVFAGIIFIPVTAVNIILSLIGIAKITTVQFWVIVIGINILVGILKS